MGARPPARAPRAYRRRTSAARSRPRRWSRPTWGRCPAPWRGGARAGGRGCRWSGRRGHRSTRGVRCAAQTRAGASATGRGSCRRRLRAGQGRRCGRARTRPPRRTSRGSRAAVWTHRHTRSAERPARSAPAAPRRLPWSPASRSSRRRCGCRSGGGCAWAHLGKHGEALRAMPLRHARALPLARSWVAMAPASSDSGTRSWDMESRSRMVAALSSSVSKSTVTQSGVPISSWRR